MRWLENVGRMDDSSGMREIAVEGRAGRCKPKKADEVLQDYHDNVHEYDDDDSYHLAPHPGSCCWPPQLRHSGCEC